MTEIINEYTGKDQTKINGVITNSQTNTFELFVMSTILKKLISGVERVHGKIVSHDLVCVDHDKASNFNRMIFYFEGTIIFNNGIKIVFDMSRGIRGVVSIIEKESQTEYDYDGYYFNITNSLQPS